MTVWNYALQDVENLCTEEFGWRGEINAKGGFVAFCPVHGDRNASLHVDLKNGAILINCMSHGCDIYKYLSDKNAWPQQRISQQETAEANARYIKAYPERTPQDYEWNSYPVSHSAAVSKSKKLRDYIIDKPKSGRSIRYNLASTHIYTDGSFAQCVIARYNAPNGKKRILQYSYGYYTSHDDPSKPTDPNKPSWQARSWSSSSAPSMMYALTHVNAFPDKIVVIVEGEKAADYGNNPLNNIPGNLVFTTWRGGTNNLDNIDWSPLSNRQIYLWPDNDDPGISAMSKLALTLGQITDTIKVIDPTIFEYLPPTFDIADYPKTEGAPPIKDFFTNARLFVVKVDRELSPDERAEMEYTAAIETDQSSRSFSKTFWYKPDNTHIQDALDFMNDNFVEVKSDRESNYVQFGGLNAWERPKCKSKNGFTTQTAGIQIQLVDDGKLSSVSRLWLKHNPRSVDRLGVAPRKPPIYISKDKEQCVNLWCGFAAEHMDQSGSCQLFLDHIHFICSKELPHIQQEMFKFIMDFLARMIQRPDDRHGHIIVLRGKQGTGKSTIPEYLRHMVGNKAFHTTSNKNILFGDFNAHLEGVVLVNPEEIQVTGGSSYNMLKDLATNSTFSCHRKGQTPYNAENVMHFIFTGNENFAMAVSDEERRILVIDIPEDHMQSTEYFVPLYKEMNNGGPAALYRYLMEYKLSNKILSIPNTDALQDQKQITHEYSKDSRVLEWYSLCLYSEGITSGPSGPQFKQWVKDKRITRKELYLAFSAWIKYQRPRDHEMKQYDFFKTFNTFIRGNGSNDKDYGKQTSSHFAAHRYQGAEYVKMPDLETARRLFMQLHSNRGYEVRPIDNAALDKIESIVSELKLENELPEDEPEQLIDPEDVPF